MRIFVTILLLFVLTNTVVSQKHKLYNPDLDGVKQIKEAVKIAKEQNKHVIVQVGGNWCPWCIKLNNYCTENTEIDSLIRNNYVLIHLNYDRKNKNEKALEMLEFPQRFGFPVLVVLNSKGKRIHTQNSGYLEENNSYSREKVIDFLNNWTIKAISKETYTKKE